jgi:hypothetical protein
VLYLFKRFQDPANVLKLNIKLILMMHLLLDEDKRNLIDEFSNDENVIGVIFDFFNYIKPKLTNMKTFVDYKVHHENMQNGDNLIHAILKTVRSAQKKD